MGRHSGRQECRFQAILDTVLLTNRDSISLRHELAYGLDALGRRVVALSQLMLGPNGNFNRGKIRHRHSEKSPQKRDRSHRAPCPRPNAIRA